MGTAVFWLSAGNLSPRKQCQRLFTVKLLGKQKTQCELEFLVVNEPSLQLKTQTSVGKLHHQQQCPGAAAWVNLSCQPKPPLCFPPAVPNHCWGSWSHPSPDTAKAPNSTLSLLPIFLGHAGSLKKPGSPPLKQQHQSVRGFSFAHISGGNFSCIKVVLWWDFEPS